MHIFNHSSNLMLFFLAVCQRSGIYSAEAGRDISEGNDWPALYAIHVISREEK